MKDNMARTNYIKYCITILLFNLVALQTSNTQILNGSDISSSSLETLNLINVTVGGDFPVSGTYPASRTERVDQLVTRLLTQYRSELFRLTPDENLLGLVKNQSEEFAKRNIILRRFSGKEINVDLIKFRVTGDFNLNPYLNNDDIIIFPPLDLERNFVQISGAVNKEIKFEFVEGEKLYDAMQIAQGINPAYKKVETVSISRLSYDGLTEDEIIVNITENPSLERGDRVRILSDENNKRDYSVLVLGEVNRPGKIFITKNNTKLADVIKKAGGFTENASLKFSELIRDKDSYSTLRKKSLEETFSNSTMTKSEKKYFLNFNELEYLKMYRTADLVMGDTLFFGVDNKLRGMNGFAQLDFRNLENSSSYESEYIVADQDVIIVPKKMEEVYVWGGVVQIGYYKYNESMDVWDYIDSAGGLTDIAYGTDEVYLIKGKSRNWFRAEEHDRLIVEPGDYIYVKKEVPQDTQFYITRVAAYASIIGSIATVILLLNQIGK